MELDSGYLSDYFTGVGMKRLRLVDTPEGSNQHEVGDRDNGEALQNILGDAERKGSNRFEAQYVWLSSEQETITEEGLLSWYDTRAKKAHRSPEWRLYYQKNPVTELMREGDTLFVARQTDDKVLFIVVPSDSELLSQVRWLFGFMQQAELDIYETRDLSGSDGRDQIDFISRFILDEMGIEFEDPNANTLDSIIDRFGTRFPKTLEFSDLARQTLPQVRALDDPDAALMTWLNHEEAMFRRLEKRVVSERIEEGFLVDGEADVDSFLQFSLGVQNRRKSRMGHSFQNHLKAVFDAFEIRHDTQVKTENGKIPDFIFPGSKEYFDPEFDIASLTMLAAKSTCKDRWPQILPEAARIPRKHLVTLEPGISENQTDMMEVENVQLVVPASLRESYTQRQREWLWSVSQFLTAVAERQDS